MDDREVDRAAEVLTGDAEWDGSAFGFAPVVGPEAIKRVIQVT